MVRKKKKNEREGERERERERDRQTDRQTDCRKKKGEKEREREREEWGSDGLLFVSSCCSSLNLLLVGVGGLEKGLLVVFQTDAGG